MNDPYVILSFDGLLSSLYEFLANALCGVRLSALHVEMPMRTFDDCGQLLGRSLQAGHKRDCLSPDCLDGLLNHSIALALASNAVTPMCSHSLGCSRLLYYSFESLHTVPIVSLEFKLRCIATAGSCLSQPVPRVPLILFLCGKPGTTATFLLQESINGWQLASCWLFLDPIFELLVRTFFSFVWP